MSGEATPLVFILSWNRPIYLWVCLDSIFRHTTYPCRIVLADNASPDPLVNRVITGFERRGLFHAVHRYEDNDPFRFKHLIERYWDQIGELFVLIEGDIEILPSNPCWLTKFVDYMSRDPLLGSVGSRVYQPDFVDPGVAQALMPHLAQDERDFLIKARAPMRRYEPTSEPLISPHNPPLRLLALRKRVYELTGFGRDTAIHKAVRESGYKSMIATEVVHRHLSLLNIFDYPGYSRQQRDDFFVQQLNSE